jgi:CheY-like chemotaxis protein
MIAALVIDDVREVADTICQMLSLLDVQADPAYGALAALQIVESKVPDIIFVDLNMPGFTGFEVIAFLCREPQLARVPVIVVTSDDQPETFVKAKQAGALDVIIKPVSFEALEKVLSKAKLT